MNRCTKQLPTRARVVFQSMKSMQMLYNTTGFYPNGADYLIGCYEHEPEGHVCYNWMLVDKIGIGCYLNQFMLEDPVTQPEDLELFHFSKMLMSVYLCKGKTISQSQYSIFWTKQASQTEKRANMSKTSLRTSPSKLPANITQICGCSVEVIWLNLHGLFLWFELGDLSLKWVATMNFLKQEHLGESRAEMKDWYQGYRIQRMEDAIETQKLRRRTHLVRVGPSHSQ